MTEAVAHPLSLMHGLLGDRLAVPLGETAARHEPPKAEPAEAYYHEAFVLAEELGMRRLGANCHYGLGMLYLKTSRLHLARAELPAAIELYRSMEMTLWLPQAGAALALAG
jgi:hypothetical protein